MKKRITLLLLATVLLILSACGHKTETAPSIAETEPETQAAPLEYAGVYRQPWREEIAGRVVEGYSYIVLNEDHTGYWITQDAATLTWDEDQLKTNVGEICRIELTQENNTIHLLVYPDPHYDNSKEPKVYEKIEKLPADMEALIAQEAQHQFSESDYPGTYCRTWREEIGGTVAQRNSYYVLNADHTGYVITQGVGKLSWNKDQITDDFGQTYNIALTEQEGWTKLLVSEFPGNPSVYEKIEKLPAEIEAMLTESPTPRAVTSAPEITKNPTTENVTEGGVACFVARADNYKYIDWYIVSADRSRKMNASAAPSNFPGVTVSGDGTTTLRLSNVPMSMDGWCVEATFTGNGGSATTNRCFINVSRDDRAPLYAVPSSGIYTKDQPVQLTAAPGSRIYYELYDDVGSKQTGTVKSGEYVYVPAIANCRYVARLVAYVIGDESNATVCEYTMDGIPSMDYPPQALQGATEPPAPSFNGGYFYNNNDAEIDFSPIGDGGFTASVGIIRVVSFDGTASYHGGVLYLDLRDPNGNYVGGEFDVESGTLSISSSSWEEVPAGSVFYGLH